SNSARKLDSQPVKKREERSSSCAATKRSCQSGGSFGGVGSDRQDGRVSLLGLLARPAGPSGSRRPLRVQRVRLALARTAARFRRSRRATIRELAPDSCRLNVAACRGRSAALRRTRSQASRPTCRGGCDRNRKDGERTRANLRTAILRRRGCRTWYALQIAP